MARKIFKANLSSRSIEQLQKDLEKYNANLIDKCKELSQKLAEKGINVAKAKISDSPLGKYISIKVDLITEQTGCKAILIATGAVKQSENFAPFNTLLAVEFGAGIHYNSTSNPNADKFGFGVGTFPGQVHAFEDGWYYWNEEKQEWQYTHGVKATMPMYNADIEIIKSIVKTAKEVFRN